MKRTRRSHKTHTFSIRVPEKIRFGLDLLATKNNAQMSALVLRAIEDMFEREGLTSRESGQLLSLLDRVWDESQSRRLFKLKEISPELLSSTDRACLAFLDEAKAHNGERELSESDIEKVVEDFYKGDIP